jgi:hypothetical protein
MESPLIAVAVFFVGDAFVLLRLAGLEFFEQRACQALMGPEPRLEIRVFGV